MIEINHDRIVKDGKLIKILSAFDKQNLNIF
jgi:hypothetical protein